MPTILTMEYWVEDDRYVGRLKEVPWVFSEGETLHELEERIRDAYRETIEDTYIPDAEIREIRIEL